jgi:hypothetical protein
MACATCSVTLSANWYLHMDAHCGLVPPAARPPAVLLTFGIVSSAEGGQGRQEVDEAPRWQIGPDIGGARHSPAGTRLGVISDTPCHPVCHRMGESFCTTRGRKGSRSASRPPRHSRSGTGRERTVRTRVSNAVPINDLAVPSFDQLRTVLLHTSGPDADAT